MVDRPATLRESLIDLRVMMDKYTRNNPGDLVACPGAQLMLDFVVNHCRIETAGDLQRADGARCSDSIRVAAVGRMDRSRRTTPW